RGYRADIDPAVLGQSFTVFAAVQLERHVRSDVQAFQKAVTQLPGVLEVHHIAGAFDYLLRVAVADLASYEIFHADRLTALPGVAHICCDVDAKVKYFAVAKTRAWGKVERRRRKAALFAAARRRRLLPKGRDSRPK